MEHREGNEDTIADRLVAVQHRIRKACREYGRNEQDVALVAISKTKPASMVRDALAAGQQDFGENYLQDALDKIDALQGETPAPVWHFVGDIQSNKTRDIAAHFAWAHAVDRYKIARRLSDQRPADRAPLNICIQVNIDHEASKSGLAPHEVAELAAAIALLPGVRLRGLMTVPASTDSHAAQRKPFARLRTLYEQLIADGHALDTLSMGMSGDLEAAIAEGATHIRIGTAVFGARDGQSG